MGDDGATAYQNAGYTFGAERERSPTPNTFHQQLMGHPSRNKRSNNPALRRNQRDHVLKPRGSRSCDRVGGLSQATR